MRSTKTPETSSIISRAFSPAHIIVAGILLSCFSGNWHYMSVPLPLDRVLIVAGVLLAVIRARQEKTVNLQWRSEHTLVVILCGWTILSAVLAGTASTTEGIFALLDRLGIFPFALLFVSPIAFRTTNDRTFLLRALVLLGLYLSYVSIADSFGLPGLFPGYIGNDSIGYHAERARGPYLEAVANGLMLVTTGVASYFVANATDGYKWRILGGIAAAATAFSLLLTLTRAAWLAGVVAAAILLIVDARSRRLALPITIAAAISAAITFVMLPSLFASVGDRAGEERPVWDRLNTNRAAFRMIEDHPIAGVGWQNAANVMDDYVRQADTYPTTGAGTPIHNVPLSRAAELGLPGLTVWAALFGTLVWRVTASATSGPVDHAIRGLTLCFIGAFLTVAMFGPLPYPQPNYLFGTLVGLSITSYLRSGPKINDSF